MAPTAVPLARFEPTSARAVAEAASRGDAGPVRMRGAYVHVPFCFHKCHYCDFYSFVESNGREGAYVDRLLDEIRAWVELPDARGEPLEHLDTMFMGGGTPTLLAPALLARLLEGIRTRLSWRADAEWSVEANPETVTDEVARVLANAGVNRVSVGCQSFDLDLLKRLERWHDPANVPVAVERLRRAGIANVNLDLIFGIPGESIDQWRRDLDRALACDPTHLSAYGLVYEPNTAMTRRRDLGEFDPIEESAEASMYEHARERLAAAGFEHYEISNWAKPGRRCRHNDLYWADADWLAFGPSASGHAGALRWKNVPRLGDWLAAGPFSPLAHAECVNERTRSGERFMLGLRRIEGLARVEVERLLAVGADGAARRAAIDRAIDDALVTWSGDRLRLTPRGLLLADSVLSQLV